MQLTWSPQVVADPLHFALLAGKKQKKSNWKSWNDKQKLIGATNRWAASNQKRSLQRKEACSNLCATCSFVWTSRSSMGIGHAHGDDKGRDGRGHVFAVARVCEFDANIVA